MTEPLYYPPAKLKLITPGSNDPRIQPVGVVLHVAATEADSLYNYFNGPSGGIESHLYLRYDGTWEQYRDLLHEADAQYKGNSWLDGAHRNGFISVETQGLGPGEWTADQIRELKAFLLWASKQFGFPLRKVPSAQPSSPARGGVGYHTLFPSWTNVAGKTCPGPQRIAQFNDVLVPWMSNPEDDLTTDELWTEISSHDAYFIDKARQAVQAELGDENVGAFSDRVAQKVAAIVPAASVDLDALAVKVADLLAARLKD